MKIKNLFVSPEFILMFKIIAFQSFSKTQRFSMPRESYTFTMYFVLK